MVWTERGFDDRKKSYHFDRAHVIIAIESSSWIPHASRHRQRGRMQYFIAGTECKVALDKNGDVVSESHYFNFASICLIVLCTQPSSRLTVRKTSKINKSCSEIDSKCRLCWLSNLAKKG